MVAFAVSPAEAVVTVPRLEPTRPPTQVVPVALAPLVDGGRALLRSAVGFWLPLAAIFVATALTGLYGPM